MVAKRVQYISYGSDEMCLETKKFIESAGIALDIRDTSKKPLTEEEISALVGHLDLKHFINSASPSFKKNGLDKALPERRELIRLMAEDYTLVRRPIIKSSRLITVGCEKKRIAEMLQLGADGQELEQARSRQSNNRSHGRRMDRVSAGK